MAITAYTGPPGSGKSFAVVAEVILPALAKGRRVCTNVAGVKPEAFYEYVAAKFPNATCGELVTFHGDDTAKEGFWPDPDNLEAGSTVLKPGDLVVFDEVKIYWPNAGKFPAATEKFLRYHRHWVGADGTATDIVLVSQMITDFHRSYRGLLESSLKFKKLGRLNLKGMYVYNAWDGCDQRKAEVVASGKGRYKSEISALYASYAGGVQGKEVGTDKRGNLFASKGLWVAVAFVVVCFGFALWGLWSFMHPKGAAVVEQVGVAESKPVAAGANQPGIARPPVYQPPAVSSEWRIAGVVDLPGRRLVVLADKAGVVRYEDAGLFSFVDGRPQVGMVEGRRVVASSAAVSQTAPTEAVSNAL